MSRLFEYIQEHEGDSHDDNESTRFEDIFECLNDIDWDAVDQYIEEQIIAEDDANEV